MAGERSRFRMAGMQVEPAFGTEIGSPSYTDIAVTNISYSFRKEALADDTYRNDIAANKPIPGSKAGSTFSMTAYFSGLGSGGAGDATAATRQPLGLWLLNALGSEALSTGGVVDTGGGTPTAVTLSTGDGAGFGDDEWAGFTLPDGNVEWRPCTVSGDVLTPDYPLSDSPDDAAVVYGSATYLLLDDLTEANSLQVQVLTDSGNEKYRALGSFINQLSVSGNVRGNTTVEAQFQCIDYLDDETDSLVHVTRPGKLPFINGHAIIYPTGASSYDADDVRAIKATASLTVSRHLLLRDDPNHAQGASMFDTAGDTAIQVNVNVPPELVATGGDTWRKAYEDGDTFGIILVFATTPGKAGGAWVRTAHLVEPPTVGDQGGIMSLGLVFAPTTGSTSPFFSMFMG